MSAYIVEDRTINRVISYLNSVVQRERKWLFEKFLKAAEVSPYDEDWQTKLGVTMAALNDRAVNARYGEGTANFHRNGVAYEFRWEIVTPVQALKSLQCWQYQCAEGDIPKTSELYKVADQLIGYIACEIVMSLPAYEKAVWG